MAERNDRARLGEQQTDRSRNNDLTEDSLSQDSMSANPREDVEGVQPRRVARSTEAMEATDRTTGDEGIDDANVTQRSSNRSTRISRKSGMRASSNRQNERSPDLREGSTVRRGQNPRKTSESFEGQGAQKEGNLREAQGTGYTNDRSGQLQEDDSLKGTLGRHGRSGSRQGSGTSDSERVGGQTAQNPRGDEDFDRSVM